MSKNNASKPKIFISYSSKDRKIVEEIHGYLASADFDVWRDKERLETDWSREIAFALADADLLCLMWSENAANSKYVRHEWVTARALEKPVYICRLGKYRNYPHPLHNRQDIPFEDIETGSKELIRRLTNAKDFSERYEYNILPKNSYIPFNPNDHFTGRKTDLLELYLKMIGNLNKIGINQVGTVGMGGIGKTQLAVEFAYRFSFAFEEVFWIQAARPEDWRKEFVRLAKNRLQLDIKNPESADADQQYIYALQGYFKKESSKSILVIMDNVSEPQMLNNDTFLLGIPPLNLGCDLLFTTRRHFQLPGVSAQAVDILSSKDAYDLLTAVRQPQTPAEQDHAHAICSAVGYLPLAVVLAKGYLNKYADISFAGYHEELIKNKLDVIDIGEVSWEELATRHAAAVGFTLQEDWKRLRDDNARILFQLVGQFGEAEIIPKARLGLLAGIQPGKSKLHRPLEKAFHLLQGLSLVETLESDARSVRLHPLVRAFSRRLIPEDETAGFKTSAAEKLKIAYFNYTGLKKELNARGVNALLEDLQVGIVWWGKNAQGLEELTLLQGALRLSANQLYRDSRQLASHLIGRLKLAEEPALQKLALQAGNDSGNCYLRPLSPSLMPPGGPLLRTIKGHSRSINAVAILQDGQTVVSASDDKTVKVWDLKSGTLRHTLEGHSDSVRTVAITPDGQAAVSASSDHTLKVWDLKSGTLRHSLEGHRFSVKAVAITPDGQTAVSVGLTTLKVWDLKSGALRHSLEGHRNPVDAVAITPDGQAVVSTSYMSLKVWDLKSGTLRHDLKGHSDHVTTVVITSNGQSAVSTSRDKTVKVWDLKSGTLRHSLEGHEPTVAITPDGQTVVSVSGDDTLKVWDLESGTLRHSLEGHNGIVKAVAITPDSQAAVSASMDKTLKVWDLKSGTLRHDLKGHSDHVTAVVITPNGQSAVSVSDDQTSKVWDLKSGTLRHTLEGYTRFFEAVTITPDGQAAVSVSWDHTLKVWDLKSGTLRKNLERHSHSVSAVAITPDGQTAVSASWDHTLKVWDLKSGTLRHSLEGHNGIVKAVAITPDSQAAVSASSDHTLKVWDLKSGTLRHSLEGHSWVVYEVAITPDGQAAVSASKDNTLKVWDLTSGTLQHSLEGHRWPVNAVATTPDGQAAVSASSDQTLKVWDLKNGTLRHSLKGHSYEIHAVAITPDGQSAVSASWDKTLKVWDLKNGTLRHSLEGHSKRVNAVVITPDGQSAVSASKDKTVKVWDISTSKEIAQFIGESSMICCAAAPDNKTIVAGDHFGQVHILRLEGIDQWVSGQ